MPGPHPLYLQRLEERRAEIGRGEHHHRILGYCKLAVVGGGATLVWLALLNRSISIIWVLIPATLLAALMVLHERVLRHHKDHIFKQVCQFLDKDDRRCTIYHARPGVCREYPESKRCGYYDFLASERRRQQDDEFIPSA